MNSFNNKKNKSDHIREMLLKTVNKNPDLFCYYTSIQEAKELLGQSSCIEIKENKISQSIKKLADG